VQKTSKSDMITSYVWHCFCTYCTKKIQAFITFQHYHVTQHFVGCGDCLEDKREGYLNCLVFIALLLHTVIQMSICYRCTKNWWFRFSL